MIAQWDSSLSVVPVCRDMIAQWNSSLSILPAARVMIVQRDSSLSVLPVCRDMIAQWDSALSVLPVVRVQFPIMADYFQGIFPWLIPCTALYTVQGVPKSGVAPPLEKNGQSYDLHEMSTDQPDLRQNKTWITRMQETEASSFAPIRTLTKGSPPNEFSSPWDTQVLGKILLTMHPGKRYLKDSAGQIFYHPWQLVIHGDKKLGQPIRSGNIAYIVMWCCLGHVTYLTC